MLDWLRKRKTMARDSGWVLLSRCTGVACGIILSSILSRYLTRHDYGLYILALAYVAIIEVLALPSLSNSVFKGSSKGYDPILDRAVGLSLRGTYLGACCLTGLALFMSVGKHGSPFGLLLLAGTPLLLKAPFRFFESFLFGKRRFDLTTGFLVAEGIIHTICIGTVVCLTRNPIWVLLASATVGVLLNGLGLAVTRRFVKPQERELETEKALLSIGWRMLSLRAFGTVARKMERLILGKIDPILLSTYHVGAMIPTAVAVNVRGILAVPAAHWVVLDKKHNIDRLRKYWWVFVGFGSACYGLIYFLCPPVLTFLYPKFPSAIEITRLMSLYLPFIFLQNMIGRCALFQGAAKLVQYTSILSSTTYILLVFALIPLYGINGAIMAFVGTRLFIFIVYTLWFVQQTNLPGDDTTKQIKPDTP